jgi:hypothetical protein
VPAVPITRPLPFVAPELIERQRGTSETPPSGGCARRVGMGFARLGQGIRCAT